MQIATDGIANSYHQMARDWMEGIAHKELFEECHYIAAFSVAEYLANKDGYTLFKNANNNGSNNERYNIR